MANNPESKFNQFIKVAIFRLSVFVLLCVGAALCAGALSNDQSIPVEVGFITFAILLFWWGFLAWRQKVNWILELQAFFFEKQMLTFHYQAVKNIAPWNLGIQQEILLKNAESNHRAAVEKLQESSQVMDKYLGSQVSEQATKMAAKSELGGELRRVYVLFSDVRGFTKMTEKIRPDETVEILNQMFTAMEEVISQNGGEINKYIGDAILAYFRRPYGNEGEAAAKVLRASLRMQERFELLNRGFKVGYTQPIEIGLGIGITAGEAIVGNLGSLNRMEFTLIGDTVNLASRFCGIAKHGQVLVNEEMAVAAEKFFELQPMPPVEVKGKSGFQKPFAVVGERMALGRDI